MHFEWTVSLGQIATMTTILALILKITQYYARIDLKLESHDRWIADHAECNKKQIEILNELRRHMEYERGMSDSDPEKRHRARRRGDPQ